MTNETVIQECMSAIDEAVKRAKGGAVGEVIFNGHGIKVEIRGGSMVAITYVGAPKDSYFWQQLVAHANSLRAGELKRKTPRREDWTMTFPAGN